MSHNNLKLTFCALLLCMTPWVIADPILLSSQELEHQRGDNNSILIDMSDSTQYQRFHLPGAISLQYETLVAIQHNISVPITQKKLLALLGSLGIHRDSNVVIYDDVGGLNAARLYWELVQIHHPHVSLLNGGLVTWILESRPVNNQPAIPRATTYAVEKLTRPFQAVIKDVAPNTRARNVILLDVRSADEYRGDTQEPRSGHIPGAKWWEWDQAVDFAHGFVQNDAATLRQSLKDIGLTDTHQPIITYCHSSHRATQAFYTLRHLGFTQVKVYTGSILEYQQHKDLPLKIGTTP